MRRAYIEHNFARKSLALIARAEEVCAEYAAQGYDLTLRQLFYQFVARDWLPNTQQSYDRLGEMVSLARKAGLIDWDYIKDRGRGTRANRHHASPDAAIKWAAASYLEALWADQPEHVEVWVEKQALEAIISKVCAEEDVPYLACKGYLSTTEAWESSQRIVRRMAAGRHVTILHLGDHDPSGMDMTRDIRDRLEMFQDVDTTSAALDAWRKATGRKAIPGPNHMDRTAFVADVTERRTSFGGLTVERIALNMDQVEQYEPPPNYAKPTDSRYEAYKEEFGEDCWELDALEPSVLAELMRGHISAHRDEEQWYASIARCEDHRAELERVAADWSRAVAALTPPQPDTPDWTDEEPF